MPSEAGTFTYTVSTTGNCTNVSANGSITVNSLPDAPTVTSPVEYCQGATTTALTATGTDLKWYTEATGGTGSTTAPTPSTATGGTTSYWVTQTVNGCESPRAQIDVVVKSTPLPTVNPTVEYCQNATATPLTATGTDLKWYMEVTGGSPLAEAPTPSTANGGTTSYYVTQTLDLCESPRAKIDVVVKTAPVLTTITGSANVCPGASETYSIDEVSDAVNYTWNVPANWTITSGGSSHSVTVTTGGTGENGPISVSVENACGISNTLTLNVVVNARPTASINNSTETVCSGNSVTASGTVSATGDWTITLSDGTQISGTGSGGFTKSFIPATTGTYTISSMTDEACAALTSDLIGQIDVTVQSNLAKPVITTPICSGSTSISGTTESGSSVQVDINGTKYNAIVTGGTWTASGFPALTAGTKIKAEASATGKCGAVSDEITVLAFLAAPTIDYPVYAGSTSVSGLHGTDGASVTVFVNGANKGTAIVTSGKWTASVTTLAANDKITARASINGGCESVLSNEVIVITAVTGTTGDYRSVAINGDWNNLSSWQINNSGTWATPTANQGYPGEKSTSGTVYIQNGSTIYTISNIPTTVGALVINGKLEVNNAITIANTKSVTVNGTIQFDEDGFLTGGGTGGGEVLFSLTADSKLITANPQGINSTGNNTGSVQTIGTRAYRSTAHFVYNGSLNQVTGTGLPAISAQGSLTINKTDETKSVSLSRTLTLFGQTYLTKGTLIIPPSITLTLSIAKLLNVKEDRPPILC